jgi:hypothetical protein
MERNEPSSIRIGMTSRGDQFAFKGPHARTK